jgi:hypothetical protein
VHIADSPLSFMAGSSSAEVGAGARLPGVTTCVLINYTWAGKAAPVIHSRAGASAVCVLVRRYTTDSFSTFKGVEGRDVSEKNKLKHHTLASGRNGKRGVNMLGLRWHSPRAISRRRARRTGVEIPTNFPSSTSPRSHHSPPLPPPPPPPVPRHTSPLPRSLASLPLHDHASTPPSTRNSTL